MDIISHPVLLFMGSIITFVAGWEVKSLWNIYAVDDGWKWTALALFFISCVDVDLIAITLTMFVFGNVMSWWSTYLEDQIIFWQDSSRERKKRDREG